MTDWQPFDLEDGLKSGAISAVFGVAIRSDSQGSYLLVKQTKEGAVALPQGAPEKIKCEAWNAIIELGEKDILNVHATILDMRKKLEQVPDWAEMIAQGPPVQFMGPSGRLVIVKGDPIMLSVAESVVVRLLIKDHPGGLAKSDLEKCARTNRPPVRDPVKLLKRVAKKKLTGLVHSRPYRIGGPCSDPRCMCRLAQTRKSGRK